MLITNVRDFLSPVARSTAAAAAAAQVSGFGTHVRVPRSVHFYVLPAGLLENKMQHIDSPDPAAAAPAVTPPTATTRPATAQCDMDRCNFAVQVQAIDTSVKIPSLPLN